MNKYNVILDNSYDMTETEDILNKIPFIKNIIDEHKFDTSQDKFVINLNNVNPVVFGHIITLIKYNISNTQYNKEIFNNNFIKNMNINTLIDFIILTHHFKLDEYKKLASNRFMNIFNTNDVDGIRKEFNIKNDFSVEEQNDLDKQTEFNDIA